VEPKEEVLMPLTQQPLQTHKLIGTWPTRLVAAGCIHGCHEQCSQHCRACSDVCAGATRPLPTLVSDELSHRPCLSLQAPSCVRASL
jgi:hypothetical protein